MHLFQVGDIANVARNGSGIRTALRKRGVELFHRFVHRILTQVAHHHPLAAGDEFPRQAETDTPAATRNHDDEAGVIAHSRTSSVSS